MDTLIIYVDDAVNLANVHLFHCMKRSLLNVILVLLFDVLLVENGQNFKQLD